MKSQQKKLSGCASNLLAHEDLGHLRKPIIGIYKPSSIMKIPTSIYESDNIGDNLYEEHGATLKHKCGKRDSNIAPSLFFSHFFIWASLFFMASLFLAGASPRLVGES